MQNISEVKTTTLFKMIDHNHTPIEDIEKMIAADPSLLKQRNSFDETPLHAILFKMRSLAWVPDIEKFKKFATLLGNIAKTYKLDYQITDQAIGGNTIVHLALIYARILKEQEVSKIFVDIAKALLETVTDPKERSELLQLKNDLHQTIGDIIFNNAFPAYFPHAKFVQTEMNQVKDISKTPLSDTAQSIQSLTVTNKRKEEEKSKPDSVVLFETLENYKDLYKDLFAKQPKLEHVYNWLEDKIKNGIVLTFELSAIFKVIKIYLKKEKGYKTFSNELSHLIKKYDPEDGFFNFKTTELISIKKPKDIDTLISKKVKEQTISVFCDSFIEFLKNKSTIESDALNAITVFLRNEKTSLDQLTVIYSLIKQIDKSFSDTTFEKISSTKYTFSPEEIDQLYEYQQLNSLMSEKLQIPTLEEAQTNFFSPSTPIHKPETKQNIFGTLSNMAKKMEGFSFNQKKKDQLDLLSKWFTAKASDTTTDPNVLNAELKVAFALLSKICSIACSNHMSRIKELDTTATEFKKATKGDNFQKLKIDCDFSSDVLINMTDKKLKSVITQKAKEYLKLPQTSDVTYNLQ